MSTLHVDWTPFKFWPTGLEISSNPSLFIFPVRWPCCTSPFSSPSIHLLFLLSSDDSALCLVRIIAPVRIELCTPCTICQTLCSWMMPFLWLLLLVETETFICAPTSPFIVGGYNVPTIAQFSFLHDQFSPPTWIFSISIKTFSYFSLLNNVLPPLPL